MVGIIDVLYAKLSEIRPILIVVFCSRGANGAPTMDRKMFFCLVSSNAMLCINFFLSTSVKSIPCELLTELEDFFLKIVRYFFFFF